jgi:hypothetical protein
MTEIKWVTKDKLRIDADGKTYEVDFANKDGTYVKVSILEENIPVHIFTVYDYNNYTYDGDNSNLNVTLPNFILEATGKVLKMIKSRISRINHSL